jgi:hydrogenase maturation protease
VSRTLVLGLGNLILSDDGVGIHAIQRLAEMNHLPEEVQVLDGGTMGLDLLHYLAGVTRLLIVDAIDMGREPGTLICLRGSQVPAYFAHKMSPHEIGVPDLLCASKLLGLYPAEVVICGIQPALTDVGLSLSAAVASQLDSLVSLIAEQLGFWGQTSSASVAAPERRTQCSTPAEEQSDARGGGLSASPSMPATHMRLAAAVGAGSLSGEQVLSDGIPGRQ